MNGAEAFIKTLHGCGVEVCFANPGTSEMQLVAAIDRCDGMRAILGLFEGVVTGAADGYGRMADKPAINWTQLAEGMGVRAVRVDTAEGFQAALADALAHKGPRLVEAMI